jgi:hypothetical protein
MPKKRTTRRRPMRGNGFFSDVWDGIKSVANPVNDFLKSTKAISTIGSLIPDGRAQAAARVAGSLGYGRRRHRMRGGNQVISHNKIFV